MAGSQAWKRRFGAALVFGALSASAAFAQPVLSFGAPTGPVVPGSAVGLDVLIADVTDLYAFQFSLAFDPALLAAGNITEGSFLPSGGTTFFDGGTIDPVTGTIGFAFGTLIGPIPGVSGSGALLHINFDVLQAGSSALTFSDVLFLDAALNDITVQVNNGMLQAVPEPATLALFGFGLAGIALSRSQFRRRAATTAATTAG